MQQRVEKHQDTLLSLSKISHIQYLEPQEKLPVAASAVLGELELLIPMADLIDKDAELARLTKEIAKLDKDISLADGKLNNPQFTDRAPADIIAKEQEKLSAALQAKEKLMQHKEQIEGL